MNTLLTNYNALKEGAYLFMENFFLYIRSKHLRKQTCDQEGIYCFKNDRILAVNKRFYDTQNMVELHDMGLYPYYITQNIFKDFLHFTFETKQPKMLLKDIRFMDESVESCIEYSEIQQNIKDNDIEHLNESILEALRSFDTDIRSLTIRYDGYDFCISNEGVLATDAPKNVIKSFTDNTTINKIIVGIY